MEYHRGLFLPTGEYDPRREILSCTAAELLTLAAEQAGVRLETAGSGEGETAPETFWQETAGETVLLILRPAAALSGETLRRLCEQPETAALMSGREVLALWGESAAVRGLDVQSLPESIARVQAGPGEGIAVTGAESAYAAQETLRRRINYALMQQDVMLVDPNTTHVSPRAILAPGCTVLPGCLIYGASRVGAGAVIGPNTLLRDADIGENCTVNSSQVNESRVGAGTTVGPFAYIRPGCTVGEHARIGNFVELKNSTVGDGTKISHLTYIGDSDLGKKINIGCGVVTVNYDGKKKYRTTVEDDSFVGCNVNLVAPVKIGRGAYLAAGGTITEDVPEESLVVARSRQTVKPGWVKKRREAGKL